MCITREKIWSLQIFHHWGRTHSICSLSYWRLGCCNCPVYLSNITDKVVEIVDENMIQLSKNNSKKVFKCQFDAVAGPSSSQAEIYTIVKKCTLSVLDGTNSTIFAYGQTGSGKVFITLRKPRIIISTFECTEGTQTSVRSFSVI